MNFESLKNCKFGKTQTFISKDENIIHELVLHPEYAGIKDLLPETILNANISHLATDVY